MIKVVDNYQLALYNCKKCGHEWLPRTIRPKQCPKCKSVNWN